jgi:hypothetical protein
LVSSLATFDGIDSCSACPARDARYQAHGRHWH